MKMPAKGLGPNIQTKQIIYWLSSFPKSGNTWMRSFISALLRQSGEEVEEENLLLADNGEFNINRIAVGRSLNSRILIEQQLGFDLSDFSEEEIACWRADATDCYSSKMNKQTYSKIHDANQSVADGRPLFSPQVTLGTLYLVRNPLDVAISYANHSDITIDQSIWALGSRPLGEGQNEPVRGQRQVKQNMLTWSQHVESWINVSDSPLKIVRYEDMKKNSLNTFISVAKFLGLPHEQAIVESALASVSFEKLKQQEQEQGFRERANSRDGFFRKGIVGDWSSTLNEEQVQQVIHDHHEIMQRLGYLDENNHPTDLILPSNIDKT